MTLRTRLRSLEHTVGAAGCPACRDRRCFSVLATPRGDTAVLPDDWPAPCPRCGDVPEQIIEIITQVVETHEQARATI